VNQTVIDQARRRVRAVYTLAEKLDRHLDDFQRKLGSAAGGQPGADAAIREQETTARISKAMDEVCHVLEETCRFLAAIT
jgi:hypothetical protein